MSAYPASEYDLMMARQESGLTQEDLDAWDGEYVSSTAGTADSWLNAFDTGSNSQTSGLLSLQLDDTLSSPTGSSAPASTGLLTQNQAEIVEKSVQAPPEDREQPSLLETIKKSMFAAAGDKDIMAKVFGNAITASAQGVMSWLKSKEEIKAKKELTAYEYDRIKQATDEKVARASAVPTMQRMTKTTPDKRPANTFAPPTPTRRPVPQWGMN